VAPSTAAGVLRAVERDAAVLRRLWRGAAFSTVVQPLLFLGAMGMGLGRLVDDGAGPALAGGEYLAFVAPGLLAASAMQTAAGDSLWPVMGGTKWFGHYHGMVASPLGAGDVFGGHVVFTAAKAGVGAVAFLAVAGALGALASPWAILAVPVAMLCAAAFAAPISAFAVSQDTDASFSVIMRLGIIPLFLFSGTFFPLEQLPAGLRPVAWVTPLWHAVELCRDLTTGQPALAAAAGHLAVLVAYTALGWWSGTRAFARRLTP
jgi:lipooligosaccharide transport system permease protein